MSDYLKMIRERGIGALDHKMGIEIIEASPERIVGTMPVEASGKADHKQPYQLDRRECQACRR